MHDGNGRSYHLIFSGRDRSFRCSSPTHSTWQLFFELFAQEHGGTWHAGGTPSPSDGAVDGVALRAPSETQPKSRSGPSQKASHAAMSAPGTTSKGTQRNEHVFAGLNLPKTFVS